MPKVTGKPQQDKPKKYIETIRGESVADFWAWKTNIRCIKSRRVLVLPDGEEIPMGYCPAKHLDQWNDLEHDRLRLLWNAMVPTAQRYYPQEPPETRENIRFAIRKDDDVWVLAVAYRDKPPLTYWYRDKIEPPLHRQLTKARRRCGGDEFIVAADESIVAAMDQLWEAIDSFLNPEVPLCDLCGAPVWAVDGLLACSRNLSHLPHVEHVSKKPQYSPIASYPTKAEREQQRLADLIPDIHPCRPPNCYAGIDNKFKAWAKRNLVYEITEEKDEQGVVKRTFCRISEKYSLTKQFNKLQLLQRRLHSCQK